jgi:sugar lactone lactonase YvrE
MGIAIDSSGNVYAAEYGYNTIEEFDPNGVGTVFAQGGYLFNPDALAFDGSGNLYVANWGSDAVIRFDPSGNVFNFASGLNSPSSIAIQVPEPSTWAMVAMGIGVVLVGLRLRRMTNIGVQG